MSLAAISSSAVLLGVDVLAGTGLEFKASIKSGDDLPSVVGGSCLVSDMGEVCDSGAGEVVGGVVCGGGAAALLLARDCCSVWI